MTDVLVHASVVIKFVLAVLAGMSIVSWGLILYKYLYLRAVERESRALLDALRSAHSRRDLSAVVTAAHAYETSPIARMMHAAIPKEKSGMPEDLARRLTSRHAHELDRLESYLIFLATTGSTAPFIGLLGTVWGIMDAFRSIGSAGSASLVVVAPAIAEALVTTAAGLAAAIPAVMAYNFFVNWVRKLTGATETFLESFQGVVAARGE